MKFYSSLKFFLPNFNRKAGVLVTYENMLLIGRAGYYKNYDIFKGSIDLGEKPLQAALRELEEESGLKVKSSDLTYIGNFINSDKEIFFLNID